MVMRRRKEKRSREQRTNHVITVCVECLSGMFFSRHPAITERGAECKLRRDKSTKKATIIGQEIEKEEEEKSHTTKKMLPSSSEKDSDRHTTDHHFRHEIDDGTGRLRWIDLCEDVTFVFTGGGASSSGLLRNETETSRKHHPFSEATDEEDLPRSRKHFQILVLMSPNTFAFVISTAVGDVFLGKMTTGE